MLTNDELNHIDEIHDNIDTALEGVESRFCLHALCATIAGHGAQVVHEDLATKRMFIADIVECIDEWMEYYAAVIKRNEQ